MRKTLSILFLFIPFLSQGQGWTWAVQATGPSNDEAYRVATDKHGHVYVTGVAEGGTFHFGNDSATGSPDDVVLSRVDENGSIHWTKRVRGGGIEWTPDVDTDDSGYVYLSGTFGSASIFIDNDTLHNHPLYPDVFIIKFDSLGNVIWARSGGGTNDERCNGIATDVNGNSYITGYFTSSTATFGPFTLNNSSGNDIFIVKYDRNGNVVWARQSTGTGGDVGLDANTDNNGNIFVTGRFTSPGLTLGSSVLTNGGSCNYFLAKMDTSGNFIWAKSSTSTSSIFPNIYASKVENDEWGNSYITGAFYSSQVKIGNTILNNTIPNSYDYFIASYDSLGNPKWAQSNGEIYDDYGYDLAADPFGSVYAIGGFPQNSGITFGTHFLMPPNQVDPMFLVQYDTSGVILCANAFPSGGDDMNAIAVDPSGALFIFGDFLAPQFICGNDTLVLSSGEDFFLGKYTCDFTTAVPVTQKESRTSIYPDPSNGKFKIQPGSALLTDENIEILDMSGRVVAIRTIPAGSNQIELDLTSLDAGIYLIRSSGIAGIDRKFSIVK